MSDASKVVDFSCTMQPASRFTLETPGPKDETISRPSASGPLLMKILMMPLEDRVELLKAQAGDHILILFAMLSPDERRELIQAAERQLKTEVR